MPAGGGTSQTAVNRQRGRAHAAREPRHRGLTIVTMLVLAPLIGLMPQATLAAVVIVYSIGLIQPGEFRVIRNVRRMEFRWALAALAGVVLLGTLKGILVADRALARVARAPGRRSARLRDRAQARHQRVPTALDEHADDETFPGSLMVRVEGRVFFANAERIGQKILALVGRRARACCCSTCVRCRISSTPRSRCSPTPRRGSASSGMELWLVGLNPEVLAVVQRSALGERLGRERMLFNLETAVAKYLADAPGR
jgi:MFS superfamily sulfate permease-like transporter